MNCCAYAHERSCIQMHNNKAVALSDLDATNFELEQAVLESSLGTYHQAEVGRKQRATDKRQKTNEAAAGTASNRNAFPESSSSSPAAASVPAAASIPAAASVPAEEPPRPPMDVHEYPYTVQELVMNGFELPKVAKAYELIGDNFDNLLAFLVSNR